MSLHAWAFVQPRVAKLTRACSYDRPGYGWSDKPSEPRVGNRAAADLHHALINAGVPEPYVLVGHSMGGGQVPLFASRYPTEVAGLVIVASGHEDWRTRSPFAPPEDESMDHLFKAIAWLSPTGLPRLFGMLFQPSFAADYFADLRKWLPERAYKSEITFLAQSKHAQAMADEIRSMQTTASELRRARNFGDIPLSC